MGLTQLRHAPVTMIDRPEGERAGRHRNAHSDACPAVLNEMVCKLLMVSTPSRWSLGSAGQDELRSEPVQIADRAGETRVRFSENRINVQSVFRDVGANSLEVVYFLMRGADEADGRERASGHS